MPTASNKKLKTISGISKPAMSKFLGYAFRNTFHECKIDQKQGKFVVFISNSESKEKLEDFSDYWQSLSVPISFLPVVDQPRSGS